VNAAFEIQDQLARLGAPEPESIWVAVGSCGTIAGLILGARLVGLRSRIVGVRIIEEDVANRAKIARLVNRASRYLRRRDPTVPPVEIGPEEVSLVEGYLGPGYAHPTVEGRQAVALVAETEGLPLETTYTGKAMAALLDHARHHPGARLLFVDTYTEAVALEEGEYVSLPERFWPVFDPAHRVHCWCLRAWQEPSFCPRRSH
jgi:D-cysteine desulfhydrase